MCIQRKGFTLIELVAVVAIVAIVALIAVNRVERLVQRAKVSAAESDLRAIAEAFTAPDGGYVADMRGIPGFSVGCLRMANILIATNLYGAAESAREGEYSRGERVDVDWAVGHGVATNRAEFTSWSEARSRGWRGPYLKTTTAGFPDGSSRRFADDATFQERGFFPDMRNLYLPDDFVWRLDGASVYGFPGEPAVFDPWGNPYVLQIPPPQAFTNEFVQSVSPETRWNYARIVSAGPDGRLETPCYFVNLTNEFASTLDVRERCIARQAGLVDGTDRSARGDDLVLFLMRNDVDEGRDRP